MLKITKKGVNNFILIRKTYILLGGKHCMWRHFRYTFENKYVSLFCEILYRWTYIHKYVYSYPKDNTFPSSEYVCKIFWFLRINILFGIFEVIKYTDQNLVLIHLRVCIIWLKHKKGT